MNLRNLQVVKKFKNLEGTYQEEAKEE